MCGIAGVFGHSEAANLVYLMLYALQHRGQESAGIISVDGAWSHIHKQMGLVAEVFDEEILRKLEGKISIGHNRYSTTGTSSLINAQPFLANYFYGSVAVAHNGNIVNALETRKRLEERGAIFQSTSDSEIIVHLIAHSKEKDLLGKVIQSLEQLQGSYSLLIMANEKILAARDPWGFRPLALGILDGHYVIASETCAFDLIDAEYLRDVEPGEVLVIDKEGLKSFRPFPKPERSAFCVFEQIYFARPDSFIFGGQSVYEFRKRLGVEIAKEDLVEADLTFPVPDSSNMAGLGYANAKRIPFEFGIIRNHYVGRTFIEPQEKIRHFGAKVKLNPVKAIVSGKKVAAVDDSIVRANTCQKIVAMLFKAGAKEVHFRVSCPRIIESCYLGIDTPTREELVASCHSDSEICSQIGATTLKYQTLDGLFSAAGEQKENYCYACLTGEYPIPIPESLRQKGKIL